MAEQQVEVLRHGEVELEDQTEESLFLIYAVHQTVQLELQFGKQFIVGYELLDDVESLLDQQQVCMHLVGESVVEKQFDLQFSICELQGKILKL